MNPERRLVEHRVGYGDLLQGDCRLGTVSYEIYIYQEFIGSAEGLKELDGTIRWRGESDFRLEDHVHEQFTLKLEDGRILPFQLGFNGTIVPQGPLA